MSDVSVIIPVYNSEKFIEEALQSLLNQTVPAQEIIVVDDGSSDGTATILRKYAKDIKYYYQENSGLASARNVGIRASSGTYLAFLDADDLYCPEKIDLQKSFLDKYPEMDMVFSNFEYFGGRLLRRPVPNSFRTGEGDPFLDLFRYNCIAIPTVLIRRECFEAIGYFDEALPAAEDYDFWLRLSRYKKIGYINRILARVRLHPANMSKDAELMCQCEIKVVRKVIQKHPEIRKRYPSLVKEKYAAIYFEAGYRFFLDALMKKARQKFMQAVKNRPLWFKPYLYLLSSFFGVGFIHKARKIKKLFKRKNKGSRHP